MGEPLDTVGLRTGLHRLAEPSGEEARTSTMLRATLELLGPDVLVEGVGGRGLVAAYAGQDGFGPRVLVRCELDAVPIPESSDAFGASESAGFSHKCGHDGHMAIVAGLAAALHDRPTARGSVVLLFQPAEETGAGAKLVLEDPVFTDFRPDAAFALHNVPGFPMGTVLLRDGVFASTARSLRVDLEGRTSHAAEPERGLSPTAALAEILNAWPGAPEAVAFGDEPAMVTVVHARLGEPALGTSPGVATVVATLRAQDEGVMSRLSRHCEDVALGAAATHGLRVTTQWLEEFPLTVCDPSANSIVEQAALDAGLPVTRLPQPFAWTEDFGRFTASFGGAMFGLGAGEGTAPLHHPDYAFPDELIPLGADLLRRVVELATSSRPA